MLNSYGSIRLLARKSSAIPAGNLAAEKIRLIRPLTFGLCFRCVLLHIVYIQNVIAHMSNESSGGNDLVKNSSLYKEFQAELNEILRHKWLESEKAGRDIGFEQALTDWIMKHRSKWRKARQAAAS
jgi:hypothetical protein